MIINIKVGEDFSISDSVVKGIQINKDESFELVDSIVNKIIQFNEAISLGIVDTIINKNIQTNKGEHISLLDIPDIDEFDAAPDINTDRMSYSGKEPHDIKKVQWVRVRRSDTDNKPINNPFRSQEDGIIKKFESKDSTLLNSKSSKETKDND